MTTQSPKPGPSPEEGVFSLEDLDKIIATEDPNFLSEMQDITSVSADPTANIESLDPDEIIDDLPDPEKKKILGVRLVEFVLLYKTKAAIWLKFRALNFKTDAKNLLISTKQYVRHEWPERIRFYKAKTNEQINHIFKWFKDELAKFNALTKTQKAGFIFILFGSIAALLILSNSWTGAWLPHFSDPLIKSLAEGRTKVRTFNGRSDLQDLFHAFPEVEFPVLLKKVVVNLKPDENSGPNPMGLYEVYLGLDSQDTAIEVKDREREVLDVIQRSLEPFTYSEVNSAIGKVRMKTAMKDELNKILNQGQVFHVYFNNFINKP